MIETIAMFERALNFAHKGNARVLIRNLMDRSWLSLGCLIDGLPCISDNFIAHHTLDSSRPFAIVVEKWPVTGETRRPLTASKRTQELTYGEQYYIVSQISSSTITIRFVTWLGVIPSGAFKSSAKHDTICFRYY